MIINDPFTQAGMGVDNDGRGLTSSQTASRLFFASRDRGEVYSLVSFVTTANAGDIIAYIRNDSTTQFLYVAQVHYGSVNAALLKVYEVSGTPAGTAIVPENLNRTSGRTPAVTCYGDGAITGLTMKGRPFIPPRVTAGDHGIHSLDGAMIFGPSQACAIEYDTGTSGAAEAMFIFFLEDISRIRIK